MWPPEIFSIIDGIYFTEPNDPVHPNNLQAENRYFWKHYCLYTYIVVNKQLELFDLQSIVLYKEDEFIENSLTSSPWYAEDRFTNDLFIMIQIWCTEFYSIATQKLARSPQQNVAHLRLCCPDVRINHCSDFTWIYMYFISNHL